LGGGEEEGVWWWAEEGTPLPEEVSLALLSFLDVPALARFSLVSRACHRLALDPALWSPPPSPLLPSPSLLLFLCLCRHSCWGGGRHCAAPRVQEGPVRAGDGGVAVPPGLHRAGGGGPARGPSTRSGPGRVGRPGCRAVAAALLVAGLLPLRGAPPLARGQVAWRVRTTRARLALTIVGRVQVLSAATARWRLVRLTVQGAGEGD
jgi:hypothetical protein